MCAAQQENLARVNWASLTQSLLDHGFALMPQILSLEECQALTAQYASDTSFRATINMEQFNFGRGEYKYFSYVIPQFRTVTVGMS